jgi:hypothetical protein
MTASLPEQRQLGSLRRLRLALEIIAGYLRARRALRQVTIVSAVDTLRGALPSAPQHVPSSLSSTEVQASVLTEARRLGRAVERTLALLPGDTRCLTRSLVLTWLLARRGIPARLVIGTRTAPDFFAHAWVEHAGTPVLPAGDGAFARLVEL